MITCSPSISRKVMLALSCWNSVCATCSKVREECFDTWSQELLCADTGAGIRARGAAEHGVNRWVTAERRRRGARRVAPHTHAYLNSMTVSVSVCPKCALASSTLVTCMLSAQMRNGSGRWCLGSVPLAQPNGAGMQACTGTHGPCKHYAACVTQLGARLGPHVDPKSRSHVRNRSRS